MLRATVSRVLWQVIGFRRGGVDGLRSCGVGRGAFDHDAQFVGSQLAPRFFELLERLRWIVDLPGDELRARVAGFLAAKTDLAKFDEQGANFAKLFWRSANEQAPAVVVRLDFNA